MPLYKKKPVPPHVITDQAFLANPENNVYKMRFTDEVFQTYE